jgi:peroxiredoxin
MATKPILIMLALAGVLSAFFFVGPRITAARQAENFRLYDSRGHLVSLDDYRGQVVVLDFYASWCGPCGRAAPEMERLYESYRDRGVVFMGLSVNDNSDPREFASRMGIQYPLLVHGEKVAEAYGVSGIPTFVVISPAGQIVHRSTGWSPRSEGALSDVIDEQLGSVGE